MSKPFLAKQPFEIKNKSETKAEILIYGAIGESFWGDSISAKMFSDELKKLSASVREIDLRINSVGGDVFDGHAIAARIKQHPAKFTTYIDGICASIATIIAIASDKVVIAEGAQMMIHRAWTMAAGNAEEFQKVIDRLDTIDEQLISAYVRKTKKTRQEIRDAVDAETWFTASEALDFGLVDEIADEAMPIAAAALDKASWMRKRPNKNLTDAQVAQKKINELQAKISSVLARK